MAGNQTSLINAATFALPVNDVEQQATLEVETEEYDYSKRAQWLRAAVLGANDGLVSTASLMMGRGGAVKQDIKMKREKERRNNGGKDEQEEGEKGSLPNPSQAAAASALAFSVGASVPLLAASFIKEYRVRLGVVFAAVTLALMIFGWLGAALGKAPAVRSSLRVLVGGWLAMAITFGLTKLIGSSGL
ncbi:hypothetical protein OIU84_013430 [Salix udensis]|uniref:Vacuolar iron transporter n=1 Tax=Salix udensis TaxID=889485 RepID=A0AAD6NUJ4_9ROSI|nr:hypothetical protein OIU84_013430 [Salix udensis]